jgi:hypothetical protein
LVQVRGDELFDVGGSAFDHIDSDIRARARYALGWRPRFLAALSITHCVALSARTARVDKQTCYHHRHADPEFAKHGTTRTEHAMDMLHARTFQWALKGDLEPIHYTGAES